MKARGITFEWLQQVDFNIQSVWQSPTIEGVLARDLKVHLDGRGEVTELWSQPWLADGFLPIAHVYQSATDYGVVKCWHLHERHTDQLLVTRGKLQVTLADIRQESPTFGHVDMFFLGALKPRLLKIPPGVLHGWKALSAPEVLVVNLQSHVYTPDDEFRFPWDCILVDIWEPKNG